MSQVTSYSWDEENRLVGVTNPDSSTEAYTYSGNGQRRSKSTLSDLIHYVWDAENILQEVDGNSGEIKAHYTDGPGTWGGLTSIHTDASTPSPGAQFNTAGFGSASFNNDIGSSSETQSFYYLFDQQASTRQLTDESADVSDEYTYRAFGEEVENTDSTRNPHRFQGEVGPYTDAEERVWMRARSYDSLSGMWISQDPIGSDGGDWNLYRFVGNNPAVRRDPPGLGPVDKPIPEPSDTISERGCGLSANSSWGGAGYWNGSRFYCVHATNSYRARFDATGNRLDRCASCVAARICTIIMALRAASVVSGVFSPVTLPGGIGRVSGAVAGAIARDLACQNKRMHILWEQRGKSGNPTTAPRWRTAQVICCPGGKRKENTTACCHASVDAEQAGFSAAAPSCNLTGRSLAVWSYIARKQFGKNLCCQ